MRSSSYTTARTPGENDMVVAPPPHTRSQQQDLDEPRGHHDHQNGGIEPSAEHTRRNAAMKLNHEAVTLLTSGSEEDRAIEILKLCLNHVKSDLVTPRRNAKPGATTTPPPSCSWSACKDARHHDHPDGSGQRQRTAAKETQTLRYRSHHCCNSSLEEAQEASATMVALPVHHDNAMLSLIDDAELYLYTKVFTFDLLNYKDSRGCLHDQEPSTVDVETLSAAIIYNLAFALTKKAMRTNCSVLLRRSIRLYEMCMELLKKIIILPRTTNNDDDNDEQRSVLPPPYEFALTIAIACSNNLGQLAYIQCEFEMGQSMRRTLMYLLSLPDSSMLLVNQQQSSSPLLGGHRLNQRPFSVDDMQQFNLNLMFMYPPTSAASA